MKCWEEEQLLVIPQQVAAISIILLHWERLGVAVVLDENQGSAKIRHIREEPAFSKFCHPIIYK